MHETDASPLLVGTSLAVTTHAFYKYGLREHARCMRTSLPSTPQLGRAIGFALHNPQELLEAISSRALSRSAAIE